MSLWRLWVIVPSVMRRWELPLLVSRPRDEEEGGMGRGGRKG